ncbi:MAG TPA: hypothetical protein VFV99_16450 [Kofleriaceae bacterium]|nr:hypothetical protein [Kofleriaceae bacterium]
MRIASLVCAALVVTACTKSDEAEMERKFVVKEITALEKALADGSESGVTVECAALRASLPRLDATTVARIERLCDGEGAKLFLRKAIADVNARNAQYPNTREINCMQLFAKTAFESFGRRPEPELEKLVTEYATLCPGEAAKIRNPPPIH